MNYELTALRRQPFALCRQTIASCHQPIGITARVTQISDISFLMNRVQSVAISNLGVRVSDCKQLPIEK